MPLEIVQVNIDDLRPSEYNPRQADEKDANDLKASIKEFGMVDPIIANSAENRKNIIIGGHFRWRIAKELGYQEVDVVYVNIPDIKKEQELNLRLNKNVGKWDFGMLANFEEELLFKTGFESEELDKIFQLDTKEDDFDSETEYQNIQEPQTKIGNLYQLGEHRLLCGDSTKEEDVKHLMGGVLADMVFTDPPYNVAYKSQKGESIMNDDMTEESFVKFATEWIGRMSEILKVGGVFYICCGYNSYPIFRYSVKATGMNFSTMIVWIKNWKSFKSWADYRAKHEDLIKGVKGKKKKAEPVIYGWNKGRHYFSDDKTEADVWEIKCRAASTMVHPTQKPLELVSRAIRNSSKRGEIVLDLFGGSGSTLISAEREGRRCYMMELDPKYCDVIIKRWERFTGKKTEIITN